jgi:hypothetical protein
MSPILGIIASSFRSAAGPDGAYDALATVTVPSGGLSTITFAGIPTGYKHLQIRYIARASGSVAYDFPRIRFNSDTASNYSWHVVRGDGNSATAAAGATQSTGYLPAITGATAASNIFGVGVTDILDYAATNKAKTVKTLGGYDANGVAAFNISFSSSAWYKNTSSVYEAVNSIDLTVDGGSNFAQHSQFALYGVK